MASTSNNPNTALLPLNQGSRVVVYHQTIHQNGKPVSLLPLITNQTGVTHVIVAAIHLNEGPENMTLNDDSPEAEKYNTLWSEVVWLQATGVKVLGMLGGAAQGSFARLDGDNVARFEAYYAPLHRLIRTHRLNGLDLDIEEPTSLPCVIRLIDRLRLDFGPQFLITLAPVATALVPQQPHLSGFSYFELQRLRGHEIAWYNVQFYCGWGDASSTAHYDVIARLGWPIDKLVLGLVTHPGNGAGFVDWQRLEDVLRVLRAKYPGFGGVMGWEYFNSMPGEYAAPWRWAQGVARTVRTVDVLPPRGRVEAGRGVEAPGIRGGGAQVPLPQHPFPPASVTFLTELGFSRQQAVAALNMTGGDVDFAAGVLLGD